MSHSLDIFILLSSLVSLVLLHRVYTLGKEVEAHREALHCLIEGLKLSGEAQKDHLELFMTHLLDLHDVSPTLEGTKDTAC